jgi:hypothetical protein
MWYVKQKIESNCNAIVTVTKSLHLCARHKTYGVVEVQTHALLKSTPERGEQSVSHFGRFTSTNSPKYLMNNRLGGLPSKSEHSGEVKIAWPCRKSNHNSSFDYIVLTSYLGSCNSCNNISISSSSSSRHNVPVHAMKAYIDSRSAAPNILNLALGSEWPALPLGRLTPGKNVLGAFRMGSCWVGPTAGL